MDADQYSFQKPYKIWSCDRTLRKSVVASSLLELKLRGAEKLCYEGTCNVSDLKVVLEADGTEVEDDGYFQTAEKDTIFILLRSGETWLPLGVEALKTALSAIPGLVSDALNKLEASDKLPNWKVSDHQGIITVVLSWDTRDRSASPDPAGWRLGAGSPDPMVTTQVTLDPPAPDPKCAQSPPILKHTQGTLSSTLPQPPKYVTTQSELGLPPSHLLTGLSPQAVRRPLPEIQHSFYTGNGELHMEYDTDSDDEEDTDHKNHDHTHCDFHCSALHRQMHIKKSVATSPILDSSPPHLSHHLHHHHHHHSSVIAGSHPKGDTARKGGKYVRFQDLEGSNGTSNHHPQSQSSQDDPDQDLESDSETTEREDDQLSERYLLLVDQLSMGHEKHLSIRDIGCILDRLSSTIVDVDKLERERETSDCHNWVIRALIKGESLREVGVVYNSNYFGIIEHPGYF